MTRAKERCDGEAIGAVLGRGRGARAHTSRRGDAGVEFIDADVENGTIELAFSATEAFTNPAGNVLGAFVAAML